MDNGFLLKIVSYCTSCWVRCLAQCGNGGLYDVNCLECKNRCARDRARAVELDLRGSRSVSYM